MVQFTVEEENLICMYHKTDWRRTAASASGIFIWP